MKRRQFITLVGGAEAAWPLAALAQVPHKRPLLVWLSGMTQTANSPSNAAFLKGMRELGYVEGSDFDLLYRFADGYADRIPSLAEEVVRLKPDVILATAADTAVVVRKLTSTPNRHRGARRPGSPRFDSERGAARRQCHWDRTILNGVARQANGTCARNRTRREQDWAAHEPPRPESPSSGAGLTTAAKALEVEIATADANRPEEIDGALHALARQRVDVVIVLQTSMLLSERDQIVAWELANRLPMVFGYPHFTRAGGLVSYGVDLPWCFYRTTYFVDKILHGTAPGDLPVEFPSKMLLVINIKTAKALGITVPSSLLVRADELIE